MFGPELIKFMRRCLFVYSVVLFTLGIVIGLALSSSPRPERHNYPAQFEPDNSSLDISRRA